MEDEVESISSDSDTSDSIVELQDHDDDDRDFTVEDGDKHVDCVPIDDDDDHRSQNVDALIRYLSLFRPQIFNSNLVFT